MFDKLKSPPLHILSNIEDEPSSCLKFGRVRQDSVFLNPLSANNLSELDVEKYSRW